MRFEVRNVDWCLSWVCDEDTFLLENNDAPEFVAAVFALDVGATLETYESDHFYKITRID